MLFNNKLAGAKTPMIYQFLQEKYFGVPGFAVEHLCLALNDLRRLGFDFLIHMFGSP